MHSFLLGMQVSKLFLKCNSCCHMTREKITQTCQQWLESRLWWWRACPPAALEIWPLSLWHKAAKCLWLQEKWTHCIETGTWWPQKASVLGRNDRWWLVWLDDVCTKLNKLTQVLIVTMWALNQIWIQLSSHLPDSESPFLILGFPWRGS